MKVGEVEVVQTVCAYGREECGGVESIELISMPGNTDRIIVSGKTDMDGLSPHYRDKRVCAQCAIDALRTVWSVVPIVEELVLDGPRGAFPAVPRLPGWE